METFNCSGGRSAVSRPASRRAIFAAAVANWLKRPAVFAIRAGIQPSGSKSLTSPTTRQSAGSIVASKDVGVLMPDFPASAAAQNFSTPTPIGETIPRPVITGWRFIGRVDLRWRPFLKFASKTQRLR